MKSPLRYLLAATATLCLAGPSFAADYNPPIFIEQAPEYVPVEIGSGWYLRGDVNYNVTRSAYDREVDIFGIPARTDSHRFGGSLGIGYHVSDLLRFDVNAGYLGGDRWEVDGLRLTVRNSNWTGMAHGYLNLGTVSGLTPYVGAGLGVLHSRTDIRFAGARIHPDDFGAPGLPERQNEFAYALNAGLAYQMSKNTALDLGYQYFNSPGTRYFDVDSGDVRRGVQHHQVKVGLRYDLW
jgi:opacity protein-like surface antigen